MHGRMIIRTYAFKRSAPPLLLDPDPSTEIMVKGRGQREWGEGRSEWMRNRQLPGHKGTEAVISTWCS